MSNELKEDSACRVCRENAGNAMHLTRRDLEKEKETGIVTVSTGPWRRYCLKCFDAMAIKVDEIEGKKICKDCGENFMEYIRFMTQIRCNPCSRGYIMYKACHGCKLEEAEGIVFGFCSICRKSKHSEFETSD